MIYPAVDSGIYLIVDVGGPESSDGSIVGVSGENRVSGVPRLVDVLHDDQGLADGLPFVEENGDLLVDGVGLEQKFALRPHRLHDVLVVDFLEMESDPRPHHEGARPRTQHLQVVQLGHSLSISLYFSFANRSGFVSTDAMGTK